MPTPEDLIVQEQREEFNDAWEDAHDYQQFLIDQARDEEGRKKSAPASTGAQPKGEPT